MRKPSLESILWVCGCGTPMGIEISGRTVRRNLDCRHCGLVGSISVYIKELAPLPDSVTFRSDADGYEEF